jgi:hypothetical protein
VQSYDACPYCLTEIVVDASSPVSEEEPQREIKEINVEETSGPAKKEKPVQPAAPAPNCSHQLGYLSKRSPKEKIPEECMMCNSIVECMLKNVTG